MKGGAPAGTGATNSFYISRVAAYSDQRCAVKPRFAWSRPVAEPPSSSVPWGLPTDQKVSTGRSTADPDLAGCTAVGQQCEQRSTDHRSGCGAEQPGPAAGRCRASGDASAIHDQCERQLPQRSEHDLRRHLTVSFPRLGSRGEWLTTRAIDKRTTTSPSNYLNL